MFLSFKLISVSPLPPHSTPYFRIGRFVCPVVVIPLQTKQKKKTNPACMVLHHIPRFSPLCEYKHEPYLNGHPTPFIPPAPHKRHQSLCFSHCASGRSRSLAGFRSTPSPSPYATALLPLGQNGTAGTGTESVYAKPESVCPSRVSYYASSQLTQVSAVHFTRQTIHPPVQRPTAERLCSYYYYYD